MSYSGHGSNSRPSISAWIWSRRPSSYANVSRYQGSTVAIVASCQQHASSTASSGAPRNRWRSATEWIAPRVIPCPELGVRARPRVGQGEHARRDGLTVDHKRAVSVFDLRHDRDAVL